MSTTPEATVWFILAGALMIAMAVISPRLVRVPFTAPLVYLIAGVALGPMCLGLLHIDPFRHAALLEKLTEIAVLIALFAAGVKMPQPATRALWRPPILVASVGMIVTIGMMAAIAAWLDWPIGAAVLLGAMLAPTDPVLATEVQSRHPGDRNRLRVTLTCEAGINDGAALPFVLLGLGLLGEHELGSHGVRWIIVDLLYRSAAGIVIGMLVGRAVGWIVARAGRDDSPIFEDMLSLGLIAAAYGLAQAVGAAGFLAVFFAAVALRRAELSRRPAHAAPAPASTDSPLVSEASLVFEERLARVIEIALVLLLGATLSIAALEWRTLLLGLFLMLVARPIGVAASLAFGKVPARTRVLTAWFGLRGLGSFYYTMYVLQHGVSGPLAAQLLQTTLGVVALSIVLHGLTVTPILKRYADEASEVPK